MARRSKADALLTRDAILDAAEQVCMARGISQITISDVASAAGISRGAVYGHFATRQDICLAMCQRAYDNNPLPEVDNDAPALPQLHALAMRYFRLWRQPGSMRHVWVVLYQKCDNTEENRPLLSIKRQHEIKVLALTASVLRLAVARGELPADLNITRANFYFQMVTDGIGSLDEWIFTEDKDFWPMAETLLATCLETLQVATHLRGQ
ncbi:TetR family transcriptional regulator [Pokkaliibacter sp. MBI-7]|uniref:TetR family transcriptional regulator n=1 Tax=Pokkaliibacter sp. MBI-7 TaxID=3040600 RepID=UPI002446C18F|nr:TetR family transcriptional regulator [Pokkaliibacter sp. MBI-7]MDH2432348.1 TetR family transcriptional regulator [Pokkaliibacter sp. MBI-7]